MKTIILAGVAVALSITSVFAQQRYHRRDDYRRVDRYASFPRTAVVIPYRNYNYHYSDGYFYRPYGSSFRIVIPPVGIYVNILPRGYRTVYYPGGSCYYYNGTYYRGTNNRYEVINAPVGAAVPELLANAKPVIINNEKLYELNGTYYKEETNSNGDITYKVVGKPNDVEAGRDVASLQVGETLQRLPEGSKAIVISGKKLYVSPGNDYFEEVIEGNNLAYKMVGNEVR